MKTRITELFEIEHPILLSGMSWVSVPELVAAVSNAGGLGILATGVLDPEGTREAVRRTRELTDEPFAANVTLYFPASKANAEVLIEEQVPVVNYSLGKGDWLCEAVHAYGGKVIATVTTLKHAEAARRHGADALIVTGHEAAGHGGKVTTLVLVPSLAAALDLPIIAAGGIATGHSMAAVLALGADAVALGTRLMNTVESPVHDAAKRASVDHDIADTVYTDRVDGLPGRFVDAPGARRIIGKHLNPVSALVRSRSIATNLGMPWAKMAVGIVASGYQASTRMARMAIGFDAFERGCVAGDLDTGVLPLGQCTGLIDDTPTVAEVMARMVAEAEEATQRLVEATGA